MASRDLSQTADAATPQGALPHHVPAILDAVASAIEAAGCPHRQGPFGLFDYSSYKDDDPPHVIRDYRDPKSDTWGHRIFRSDDPQAARQLFDTLTRRHIAQAAINAYLSAVSDGAGNGTASTTEGG